MIPGSDTAKQDLTLVITGAVCALLFFWLYSDFHPLSRADNSLGSVNSGKNASEVLSDFGYNYLDGPVSSFHSNSTLLDSLQKQTDFAELYSNPLYRSLYPAFYWENTFKTGEREPAPGAALFENPAQTISVQLSENGRFIALGNENNTLPARPFIPEVISYGFQFDELPAFSIEDTLLSSAFQFQFSGVIQPFDSLRIATGNTQLINRQVAERMAEYYLTESGWPERQFEVLYSQIHAINGINTVEVIFGYTGDFLSQSAEISVVVLPAGSLLKMGYDFDTYDAVQAGFSEIKTGLRSAIILLGIFWLIILLFIRFRMRLVDIKLATLVAVLAGLISPFLVVLEQMYNHFNSFGTLNFSFILSQVIAIGFFAAITSLGFFAVTATSDSITRQHWKSKLQTVDLLRVGHALNIPVGLNLIRGISYAFIITLAWYVSVQLIPNSYISIESTVFNANKTYLPFLTELLGNIAVYFIATQVIFLIITGYIRSTTKNTLILIAAPVFLFTVLYPFPFQVGGFDAELLSAGVVGLAAGCIYYKEDFLTTFISLFFFVTAVNTAPGWVIPQSPDSFSFVLFISLIVIGFIVGSYSIYKGEAVSELPDFVPKYVLELAQEDRIKQELQIARKVQQSFLPVRTPQIEGLDIAAICKPAYETGGDYYDLITLEDGRLAVTIGDVSGKGIQAAFYMTFIKGVLHSLCNDYRSTIEVLTKTNKLFRQNANRGTFISLIFGVVNVEKNTFMFSRAGHNPLLYYENNTQILHEFKPEGLAIGMADETTFKKYIGEQRVDFNKGDMLIFFTDGVVEAISKTNKVYGDQRLHALIQKYNNLPSVELIAKLEKDLRKFGENTPQHDDMTMIVIKKK